MNVWRTLSANGNKLEGLRVPWKFSEGTMKVRCPMKAKNQYTVIIAMYRDMTNRERTNEDSSFSEEQITGPRPVKVW